jgi:hypothetical protein
MTELLSEKSVNLIMESTLLANKLGIEGLVLDSVGIRGYNDDEGIIVASIEDHGFEFDSLGLTRLQSLMGKTTLLKSLDSYTVTMIPKKGNPDVIEKLAFDGGKIDFEFRCALPKAIKDIPSTKLNKTAVFYFDITQEDVANISKSMSAMRSKHMTIQGNGSNVKFRFSDEAGDILNFTIDSDLETASDIDNFSLTINLKKMLPILKIAVQDGSFRLNILKNNILYIAVGNMDVLVMPEV